MTPRIRQNRSSCRHTGEYRCTARSGRCFQRRRFHTSHRIRLSHSSCPRRKECSTAPQSRFALDHSISLRIRRCRRGNPHHCNARTGRSCRTVRHSRQNHTPSPNRWGCTRTCRCCIDTALPGTARSFRHTRQARTACLNKMESNRIPGNSSAQTSNIHSHSPRTGTSRCQRSTSPSAHSSRRNRHTHRRHILSDTTGYAHAHAELAFVLRPGA